MSPDPSGGDTRKANPSRISEMGGQLNKAVGAHLTKAWNDLEGDCRKVEDSNFTSTSYLLSVAYVEALEFMEEDLKSKREDLNKLTEGLIKNASGWHAAEQKSTVRKAGG